MQHSISNPGFNWNGLSIVLFWRSFSSQIPFPQLIRTILFVPLLPSPLLPFPFWKSLLLPFKFSCKFPVGAKIFEDFSRQKLAAQRNMQFGCDKKGQNAQCYLNVYLRYRQLQYKSNCSSGVVGWWPEPATHRLALRGGNTRTVMIISSFI